MKNSFIAYATRIGKYYLFLIAAFALERAAFLVTNATRTFDGTFADIIATFYHAFHLDLSTACYMAALPLILLTLQLVWKGKWFQKILDGYTLVLIIFLVFTALGNIFLYKEWDTKLNYKIWAYLSNPVEVLRTATWIQLTAGTVGGIGLCILYYYLYWRWFSQPTISRLENKRWLPFLFIVFLLPLDFVGIRGRISGIPISQSSAYFSKYQVLNDAAVNTQWNLIKSTIRFGNSSDGNPFVSMPMQEATELVKSQFVCPKDTCIKVLKNERPNIVIILLESWSADLIESLGGVPGVTPNFKQLEKEGLLFTQIYAAGHRSQEGISSIVSGFPPVPVVTITDNFEKYGKLASIANSLKKNKYQTSFQFGGDLTYGNLRAYLMAMGFDQLIDEEAFPKNSAHGKLSIYDEVSFDYHLEQTRKSTAPFFSILFTASTHSPYDVPSRTEPFTGDMEEVPYLNSAKYTDWCLGQYFAKAKKEGWYENTLFILVADHSHRTYKLWDYYDAGYQHIPMLWTGGALKEEYRGKSIDKLCSYLDLPLTLLLQMEIDPKGFEWSNNIFNPYTPQFAIYPSNQGIGWITPDGAFGYDASEQETYRSTFKDNELYEKELMKAKAYLQVLYQKYLDL